MRSTTAFLVSDHAEEGWTVVGIEGCGRTDVPEAMFIASIALGAHSKCDAGPLGVIVFDPDVLDAVVEHCASVPEVAGVIAYGAEPPKPSGKLPVLAHLPPRRAVPDGLPTLVDPTPSDGRITRFTYPSASSPLFALPSDGHTYNEAAAGVAHTRSLAFLKPLVGGPYFDLVAIWDEHVRRSRI